MFHLILTTRHSRSPAKRGKMKREHSPSAGSDSERKKRRRHSDDRKRHHRSSREGGEERDGHRRRHHHHRSSSSKEGTDKERHRRHKHRSRGDDDRRHRHKHRSHGDDDRRHRHHHSSRHQSSSPRSNNDSNNTSSTSQPLSQPSQPLSQPSQPIPTPTQEQDLPPLPLNPSGVTLAENLNKVRPPDAAYFEQLLPNEEDQSSQPPPPPEEKHVPSFSLSGALATDAKTGNMKNGVVLKYNEPEEARMPTRMYRLYVFKNGEQVDVYHIHRQSHFLFGRNRTVVHVPVDHPSSSSQHAVIQYRFINGVVKPYLIDIESTNGTWLNNKKLESARYYELKDTDMIKFGTSVREYVLMDAGERKED